MVFKVYLYMMCHLPSNQNYKRKKMILQSWCMLHYHRSCVHHLHQRIHHHLKQYIVRVKKAKKKSSQKSTYT